MKHLPAYKELPNASSTRQFCMLFCRVLIFRKINFFKKIRNIIRLSNSLDPKKGPNCLQTNRVMVLSDFMPREA